jgi:hypothetical protein
VQTIAVSTVVRLPPDDVFDFLLDFPGYAKYSKYLRYVTRHGEGGEGTEYDLHFRWWKLSYTARSRVTSIDPPHVIHWNVVKDFDAFGRWVVEHAPDEVPDDAPGGSRVRLIVTYDATSVRGHHLDLPRLIPLEFVVDRAIDLIVEEGKRVVQRVVADLEGDRRPITLEVNRDYDPT